MEAFVLALNIGLFSFFLFFFYPSLALLLKKTIENLFFHEKQNVHFVPLFALLFFFLTSFFVPLFPLVCFSVFPDAFVPP